MSSGVFRGKKSLNRIELSQLVQDLLNFGVLGSLQLCEGHLGAWGVPRHVHIHGHPYTCTHAYVYMYRNCKWLPTWRHPCLSCLTCMCVHVHACVHGTPPTHPYLPPPPSIHLPPLPGDPRISKNSIMLELIKIFQFHVKI